MGMLLLLFVLMVSTGVCFLSLCFIKGANKGQANLLLRQTSLSPVLVRGVPLKHIVPTNKQIVGIGVLRMGFYSVVSYFCTLLTNNFPKWRHVQNEQECGSAALSVKYSLNSVTSQCRKHCQCTHMRLDILVAMTGAGKLISRQGDVSLNCTSQIFKVKILQTISTQMYVTIN